MRAFVGLVVKEVRGAFNTPIAYVVVAGFLVFTSVWLFVIRDFFGTDIASLRDYYGLMPIVFVVLVPAVTMRSWAEERHSGTDEILLTLPVSEATLVVAKYVANLSLVVGALALTGFVPLFVVRFGDFDGGVILGQYAGLTLLASSTVAVGQFVSGVTRNQISAFILGVLALLLLTLVGTVGAAANLPSGFLALLDYLSLDARYRNFVRGVVDTRDVVYFVGLTVIGLALNARALLLRKVL